MGGRVVEGTGLENSQVSFFWSPRRLSVTLTVFIYQGLSAGHRRTPRPTSVYTSVSRGAPVPFAALFQGGYERAGSLNAVSGAAPSSRSRGLRRAWLAPPGPAAGQDSQLWTLALEPARLK